jgi:hypothetical protein
MLYRSAQVVVLPGHNYGNSRFSAMGNETQYNLAFRCKDAAQFKVRRPSAGLAASPSLTQSA